MKVIGLNGREYNLDLKKYLSNNRRKVSNYHAQARELIHDLFRGYSILEEVKLPGSRNAAKKSVLFLDFLIPNAKIGVEVQGKQHYEFVPFFHKNKAGFFEARARDITKAEWCDINDISLIKLKYDEPDNWRNQLERSR